MGQEEGECARQTGTQAEAPRWEWDGMSQDHQGDQRLQQRKKGWTRAGMANRIPC